MTDPAFTQPVQDSVSRVNQEVAVGEDLEFQRKWWRFENGVWIFFVIILLLDLAGLFGRGPIAKAHRVSSDNSIDLTYERIERTQTPSVMTIRFASTAIENGTVHLFISQSLIDKLGTERVIPSPQRTEVGSGGLTYTFPTTTEPATVELALRPSGPGYFSFTIGVPGASPLHANIAVMP